MKKKIICKGCDKVIEVEIDHSGRVIGMIVGGGLGATVGAWIGGIIGSSIGIATGGTAMAATLPLGIMMGAALGGGGSIVGHSLGKYVIDSKIIRCPKCGTENTIC